MVQTRGQAKRAGQPPPNDIPLPNRRNRRGVPGVKKVAAAPKKVAAVPAAPKKVAAKRVEASEIVAYNLRQSGRPLEFAQGLQPRVRRRAARIIYPHAFSRDIGGVIVHDFENEPFVVHEIIDAVENYANDPDPEYLGVTFSFDDENNDILALDRQEIEYFFPIEPLGLHPDIVYDEFYRALRSNREIRYFRRIFLAIYKTVLDFILRHEDYPGVRTSVFITLFNMELGPLDEEIEIAMPFLQNYLNGDNQKEGLEDLFDKFLAELTSTILDQYFDYQVDAGQKLFYYQISNIKFQVVTDDEELHQIALDEYEIKLARSGMEEDKRMLDEIRKPLLVGTAANFMRHLIETRSNPQHLDDLQIQMRLRGFTQEATDDYISAIERLIEYENTVSIPLFKKRLYSPERINRILKETRYITSQLRFQADIEPRLRGGCFNIFGKDFVSCRHMIIPSEDNTKPTGDFLCGIRCILKSLYPDKSHDEIFKLSKKFAKEHFISNSRPLTPTELCFYFPNLKLIVYYRIKHVANPQKKEFGNMFGNEVFLLLLNYHFFLLDETKDLSEILRFSTCQKCGNENQIIGIRGQLEKHTCPQEKQDNRVRCYTKRERLPTPIPNSRILFCDFETFKDENQKMIIYAFGIADGEDPKVTIECDEFASNNFLKKLLLLSESSSSLNPYYIYFYNGSGFDLILLLKILINSEIFPSSMMLRGSRILDLGLFENSIRFRDLYLFTTCSLSRACKDYGLEENQSKTNFDHDKINSFEDVTVHREEISKYLTMDIISMKEIYLRFSKVVFEKMHINLAPKLTLSQLSFDAFKIATPLNLPIPNLLEDQLIRKAYYGARTFPQIFVYQNPKLEDILNGKIKYDDLEENYEDIDAVSLYPTCMISAKTFDDFFKSRYIPTFFYGIPTKHDNGESFASINQFLKSQINYIIKYAIESDEVLAMKVNPLLYIRNFPLKINLETKGYIVCVDFKCPDYIMTPLLPTRDDRGQLVWDLLPKKEQSYVLEELIEAICNGYEVTKLHYILEFNERAPIFDRFVTKLYEMKKEAKKGTSIYQVAKNLLNSLYGKFAQLRVIFTKIIMKLSEYITYRNDPLFVSYDPIYSIESYELEDTNEVERDIIGFIVKSKNKKMDPNKPVYIAAQITAYSRMYMNRILNMTDSLLDEKRSIGYTDTDSLVISKECSETLKINFPFAVGNQMGQMDDELGGGKIVAIYCPAPKFYCYVYITKENKIFLKIRSKGFPHPNDDLEITDYQKFLENRLFSEPIEKLKLNEIIFELELNGNKCWLKRLDHLAFGQIMSGAKISIYFRSFKRTIFSKQGFAEIQEIGLMKQVSKSQYWEIKKKRVMTNNFQVSYPKGHFKYNLENSFY